MVLRRFDAVIGSACRGWIGVKSYKLYWSEWHILKALTLGLMMISTRGMPQEYRIGAFVIDHPVVREMAVLAMSGARCFTVENTGEIEVMFIDVTTEDAHSC